jgi:hypothetical protein
MNLGACPALQTGPETGVWFRAVQPQHWPNALETAHTVFLASRFSPATASRPAYRVLYLAENQLVALFEVEAVLGSPFPGGTYVPNPSQAWTVLNIRVTLQRVADISDVAEQAKLGTTAQELTGDWKGYLFRNPFTPVSRPTGPGPTQDLGQALYNVPGLEAFRAVSAKMPTHRNLVVFPGKLQLGSKIEFTHPATGQSHTIQP